MANPPKLKLSSLKKSIKQTSGLAAFLGAIGVSLLIILGAFSYSHIYSDPQRVFWGMIGNNLATNGVTRQVIQTNGPSKSNEISQITFGANPTIHIVKKISDSSSMPATRLTLEGIVTPTDDYQRYSLIDRPPITAQGKLGYSKIYTLWVRSGTTSGADRDNSPPQLFNQTLFGAMIFCNLPQAKRSELVAYLKNHPAYKVDFAKIQRVTEVGRSTYVYKTEIMLRNYAGAVQLFAKALGLSASARISPSSYALGDKLNVEVSVDVLSRQLIKIGYLDSGAQESYSGYGLSSQLKLPTRSVNSKTFQEALRAI